MDTELLQDAARKENAPEEHARQQLKEVEMKGIEVQAQLREWEIQKETKLQLLLQCLEDTVALKSAKRDVQDALMDCIMSLQSELKKY